MTRERVAARDAAAAIGEATEPEQQPMQRQLRPQVRSRHAALAVPPATHERLRLQPKMLQETGDG